MFRSTREPCELSPTASFGLYLHFYAQRVGLSETVLAEFARMNQSTLNKITNIARHGVSVDTLVCLCLALGLTEEEAMDLMARKERTFSPADPRHTALLELIRIYAEKEIDYTVDRVTRSTLLDDADAYLIERGLSQPERLMELNKAAIRQMKVLAEEAPKLSDGLDEQ